VTDTSTPTTPEPALEPALDEAAAAAYLRVSRHALEKWRREGRGPSYIRLHRRIRYLRRDVDAWIAAHRVSTTQGA